MIIRINMDQSDVDIIESIYKKVLNKNIDIHDNNYNDFNKLKQIHDTIENFNNTILKIVDTSKAYSNLCLSKYQEMKKEFLCEKNIKKNTESWADINDKYEADEYIINKTKDFVNTVKNRENITISNMDILPMQFTCVSSLKDIPQSMYWYNGSEYKHGIYINISPGFYAQVPYPSNINSYFNKCNSIKCKYESTNECDKHQEYNIQNNTKKKKCLYAHLDDTYSKIAFLSRCPKLPQFGNLSSLHNDINKINITDINIILLYSLSDILLSKIWYNNTENINKNDDIILVDLDIVK